MYKIDNNDSDWESGDALKIKTKIYYSKTNKKTNMESTPTKTQILEAASTSPEAKLALAKLFPQYFSTKEFVKMSSITNGRGFAELENATKGKIEATVAHGITTAKLRDKAVYFSSHSKVKSAELVVLTYNGEELFRADATKAMLAFEVEML